MDVSECVAMRLARLWFETYYEMDVEQLRDGNCCGARVTLAQAVEHARQAVANGWRPWVMASRPSELHPGECGDGV